MSERDPEQEPSPRPFATLPGSLGPLGYRNYLLFWIGFVVSNTGRWVELTGALWLASELTDSLALLGGLGLARALPALVLSPIAGVYVDRLDQRRVLIVTQGVSLSLSLVLGISILIGRVELWQIYVQLALQSCVQPFDVAARQALFPRLVPRLQLPNAVTLTVTAARTSKFVGPAIGGLLIATLGEAWPYLVNAASFLVLMLAVLAMRAVPPLPRLPRATFGADLREGLQTIRQAPLLNSILLLELVFGLFQVNDVMITIVAREILHVGPEGLGLLLGAPALGALLGAVGMLLVRIYRQGRFAVVCVVAYAGTMLVVASSGTFALTFLALAVTGLLDCCVTIVRLGIMQLSAPPSMRGRVMANMGVVTSGIGPLSQVQSGVLAGVLGAPLAIATSAVAMVATSAWIARRHLTLWRFTVRATPAAGHDNGPSGSGPPGDVP